jgi:hypothetical protein
MGCVSSIPHQPTVCVGHSTAFITIWIGSENYNRKHQGHNMMEEDDDIMDKYSNMMDEYDKTKTSPSI